MGTAYGLYTGYGIGRSTGTAIGTLTAIGTFFSNATGIGTATFLVIVVCTSAPKYSGPKSGIGGYFIVRQL